RSGAAGWIAGIRIGRRASAGSARAAAKRPRERRAPQAGRRAGRHSSPLDAPRRRISRSGALVDVEGRLGRPLGIHRAARALSTARHSLMNQLPVTARLYVISVIVIGLALLVVSVPEMRLE